MADSDAEAGVEPFSDIADRRNVMLALTERALAQPNAVALEIGDRSLTYAQLDACVLRAAHYLYGQGVGQGTVVALRLTEPVPLAFAIFALMRIGATPMPVSPSATPHQVEELLREAGAKWLLAEPDLGERLPCPILAFSEVLIDDLAARAETVTWPDNPAAPCLLIVGSGTTGKPRLMPVTHAQMRARCAMRLQPFGLLPGDRIMTVSPLHFALPTNLVMSALFGGATAVLWDQRGKLAAVAVAAKPDILYLSVMHAEQILNLERHDQPTDFAAIRAVVLTSSTVSEALRQRLRHKLNARLHVTYGANEMFTATVAFPEDIDAFATGVGRQAPGVRVEIVDAEDRLVEPGAVGQVRVRSPAQIDGYFNHSDPERFRGGWFYPGDLARWDPCGQLVLMGRADEMMIMNGINIYPADIELALCEHPAVREAAAFALRHQVAQDLPVCVVALNGGTRLSKKELMDFARVRLGANAPRVIAIVAEIPRNLQGKLVRAELIGLIRKELQNDAPPSAEQALASIGQRKKTAALVEANPQLDLDENFLGSDSLADSDANSDGEYFSETVDCRNVMLALTERALAQPNAVALEIGDRSLTYAQLDACVLRAAHYLYGQGVGQGTVVALRLTEPVPLAFAIFALMRIGATPMPVSPSATPHQVEELLREAGARWFLADPGVAAALPCAILAFSEALIGNADVAQQNALSIKEPSAPCLLITGSGTTGKPRLMAVTHAQMRARLATRLQPFGLTARDRVMTVSPMFIALSTILVLSALSGGATGVVWDQRGNLLDGVVSAKPDILYLSVMHAEHMLQLQKIKPTADLAAIRAVVLASSTVSGSLRHSLRRVLKARVHVGYGTNEVSQLTTAFPQDLDELAGGVGRPNLGVAVEIVDEDNLLVAPGEVGQVRARSPAQIDGYFNHSDPERFRGGWFYPGDLARWDPCGQLVLMGRADEMMIMNGINIYPADIELALCEHPAVREVAAFPLRHQVAQDLPACVVSLNHGMQLSKTELMNFARNRLGYKAPHIVAIAEAIPRNFQGKLVRAELIALVKKELQNDAPPSAEDAQAFIEERNKAAELRPLHQRCRRVAFDFILPASPGIENLRSWRLALQGADGGDEIFAVPFNATVSQRAVMWVTEVLRIFDALLLTALAPVFCSHRLLFCKPKARSDTGSGTGWHAGFEMPLLEGHAEETPDLALKAAFAIAQWARQHPDFRATDAVAREAFFALTEKHGLEPLRGVLPQGKSTLPVLRAAFDLGIPFSHLGGGIYQLGWGAKARRISRSSTDQDSAIGAALAARKNLAARLLRSAGLPGPVHVLVNTAERAHAAAERIGWPVVVKPADAERGVGVHVDVQADGLDAAFMHAYQHSAAHLVLIERQVQGICHRVFVARGQLLYAVKRLPMGVYGDGKLTVAQLVEKACVSERPSPASKRSPQPSLDELALTALVRQGIRVDAVPPARHFVALRRIETSAWGGVDEDVTATIHPDNLRAALAASELCGLDVAGVDMISTDITVPWYSNGAVINEVNFAPFLGEGVISQRHVKPFLSRLMDGNGRIPVEVYVGGAAAADAARQCATRLHARGLATALTTHDWTEAPDGKAWPMAADGLHARVRALVLSVRVDALVIVVQTDELVDRDLPLEGVDTVHLIDEEWRSCQPHAALQRKHELFRVLQAWQWTRAMS